MNGRIDSHASDPNHSRTRMAGAFLMVVGLLTTLFAFVALPAEAVTVGPDPTGALTGFEIEGNLTVQNAGKIDWANASNKVIVVDDTLDSGLQGTSKENDPSGWVCNDGGANPPKTNLLAAAINTRVSLGAIFLDMAYIRQVGNGSAHVNFEFNQNAVTSVCPNDYRTTGDLLLLMDFPGNGSDSGIPTIEAFLWDDTIGTDGEWVPNADIPATIGAGAENDGNLVDTLFNTGTRGDREFGEFSIDLLAALDIDQTDLECREFGTLQVRSRSSGESITSALQDTLPPTLIDLSTCGSVTIHKTDDAGTALAGSTFGLFTTQQLAATRLEANAVDVCTSLANGNCVFADVPPGDYFIAEISAPAGYDIDPDIVPVSVAFRENVDVAAPFVDPRHTGFVEITKAIEGVPNPPPGSLDGATFELHQNGVIADLWPNPPAGQPATCTIQPGADSCVIGPVEIGTYDVVETVAPEGTTIGAPPPPVVVVKGTIATPVLVTYTNPPNPIQILLDKSGPDVADIGTTFNYTFAVTNTGELALHNVVLSEIPAFDQCTGPITGPVKTGGNQDDILDVGGIETWTYTCPHLVTPADGATIHNEAQVDAVDIFDRPVHDEDDHDVIVEFPDLQVVKTADSGTVNAGGTASFTIVVTNVGDAPALNSTLTDTLPAGAWTVGGPDGDDCDVVGSTLSCAFGTITVGGSRTITVSRSVTTADCGPLLNTVTVATTYGGVDIDDNDANNTSSATVNVTCPDVTVAKTAADDTISAGETAVFTIVVSNLGAGAATGVDVVDNLPLPAGIDWEVTADSGSPDCVVAAGALDCAPFDLGPAGSPTASRTITVSGVTDEEDCTTLPNTAVVSAANGDSNPGNNTSTATITVQCPDLDIVKEADETTVVAGDPIGFGIVVSNAGPGTAFGVTLDDPLPAGPAWVLDSVTPAGGAPTPTCGITAGTLTCSAVDLASGQSYEVHVSATTSFLECGTYLNVAIADATNSPPVQDAAAIACLRPEVSITKTAVDDQISAGEPVVFDITVTNSGPGEARDLDLFDVVPDGVVWSLISQRLLQPGNPDPIDILDCSITPDEQGFPRLDCLRDLLTGESITVRLSAPTTFAACTLFDNTARLTGSNIGPDLEDDAQVLCLVPGLNIVKTADDPVVQAGEKLGFTINVLNFDDPEDPAGDALGVVVTDPLPAGVLWKLDSVTGVGGQAAPACAINGVEGSQTLSCAAVDLGPDEGFDVHVSATTAAGDCATYDNTATATPTNAPAVSDDAQIGCLDIELVKGGPAVAAVGATVTYTFQATNTGGVDLVNVVLSDPNCDSAVTVVTKGNGDATMQVGEVWTFTCTRVIEASDPDPVPNVATVTGNHVITGEPTSDTDDHSIDVSETEVLGETLARTGSDSMRFVQIGLGAMLLGLGFVLLSSHGPQRRRLQA